MSATILKNTDINSNYKGLPGKKFISNKNNKNLKYLDIKKYYEDCFKNNNTLYEKVGYPDQNKLNLRYKIHLNIINLKNKCSLLDFWLWFRWIKKLY